MTRLVLLIAATLATVASSAMAAISVGPTGSAVLTFDSFPAAADWSTVSIGSASVDYSGAGAVAALDAAVQVTASISITNAVDNSSGNPPGTSRTARWSSTGHYLQTMVEGGGAALLMVTLTNTIGAEISAFDVQYDLAVPIIGPEDIPGQRVYYSMSGAPNSWVVIGNFAAAGPQTIPVNLADILWSPNSTMYLLFADDNAVTNPDGAYQIDNFVITNVLFGDPSCVAITNQPQSIAVPERGPATFSLMASGAPQRIQWYRSDNGGVSYSAIEGANTTNYSIASAMYPEDNGARFQATISNLLCSATSSVATLTVYPDTNAPTVLRAVGAVSPDTIALTFSEAIDPASFAPNDFILFETGTDPSASLYATYDATLANETNITLVTDPREPGKNYSVRLLYLEDASSQNNPINPTNIPLRQTIQLVGFDTDNVWKYDIDNGDRFGTGWEMAGYDDSTWPSGLAGLGFDGLPNGVPIRTQLPYQGNSAVAYFRTHFTWPGKTNGAVLHLRDVIDDGAVFYLNGQEILRHRMPTNVVNYSTRAIAAPEPTLVEGPFSLSITNLHAGDNVLAVAVHQSSAASGDIMMAAELTGEIQDFLSSPPRVSISRDSSTGQVTIRWPCCGTLQETTNLGPGTVWIDVQGNPNPYTFTPSAEKKFFSLKP